MCGRTEAGGGVDGGLVGIVQLRRVGLGMLHTRETHSRFTL
jgi:hypothetical protein